MAEEKKTKKRTSRAKSKSGVTSGIQTSDSESSVKVSRNKPSDDRVMCVVCGRTAPRATSTKVGESEYVCSSRCLSRYGQTHRQHAHNR